jgi:uncharacterized protein
MPSEIIKLLIILVSIIFLLKINLNLCLNLLINSALIGLLFRVNIIRVLIVWRDAILNQTSIELLSIIFFLYFLSICMEKLKKFERMVYYLQEMIKDYRLVMILIPSFVSLLPIQGGAIFSAPMIKSIGDVNKIGAEKSMFINYWFRHIITLVYPMNPSIILYASLLSMSLKNLILLLCPFAIIAFLSGTIWLYLNMNYYTVKERTLNHNKIIAIKGFFYDTWPIFMVVILTLIFNIMLLFSLFLVLLFLFIFNTKLRVQWKSFLFESLKSSYKTLFLLCGIFIFKGMLEYSQVVTLLPEYFLSLGVPLSGVLVIVPFLIGFFTGSVIAYIGICVPIFSTILVGNNVMLVLSRVMLLFISGHIGMMLTPIHLCLAVTKDYFHVKINKFYNILITHIFVLGIFSLFYFLFLIKIVD